MRDLAVTSMSSKGQVVIPAKIRDDLGLQPGVKLMVATDGESVLLKPIQPPSMAAFEALISESRKITRELDLAPSDLQEAIRQVRSEDRR